MIRSARTRTALLGAVAVAVASACSDPRQVSDSGFGAYEVSLTGWDDGLAVGWYDTRDGNGELYVRMLGAEGRAAGPELRLTQTPAQSYEIDLAAVDGGFAAAWYEKAADGALRAQLGAWNRDGTPRWRLPLGSGDTRNPVLRARGDALFCAWIEREAGGGEAVRGGWWGVDGTPRTEPVTLGRASETTWNLNAAVHASGSALVAFDARADTWADELFIAELARGTATLARVTADDGRASKYPDIALNGDTLALTWFDERDGNQEVYLAVAPKDALLAGAEPHMRRVTDTAGHSIGAYLAWNGPRLGVAWSDDTAGAHEVYFRAFDADGTPLAAAERLTRNSTSSLIPAIRAWRTGFAVAWSEVTYVGGSHSDETRSEVHFALVP